MLNTKDPVLVWTAIVLAIGVVCPTLNNLVAIIGAKPPPNTPANCTEIEIPLYRISQYKRSGISVDSNCFSNWRCVPNYVRTTSSAFCPSIFVVRT
jgi:hypothetical protein